MPEDEDKYAHFHKCGHASIFTTEEDRSRGCGHVWKHSSGEHDNHMCPECGEGPWAWTYNPSQEEQKDETVKKASV